jgi:type III secretory pathway component EscS
MTGLQVMDVAREAIVTLLLVAAPLMLVGLIVGVAVSLLQALTQIQETSHPRHRRGGRLPVPVPAMVRAAQNVAA